MTEQEQEKLIKKTVEQTFLLIFGADTADTEELREIQKDMLYVRSWRLTMEQVQSRSFWGLLSILGAGLVAATWMGIQAMIKNIASN